MSRRRRGTSRAAFRGKMILVPVAALALILGAGLPQAASPATGASPNAPVAANDSATTAEDTAVDVNVLANDTDADGDALAISTFTQGANGTVALVAGRLRYTPAANFNGSDSFTYTANDGTADSNVATVTITVTEVNDLPIPNVDSKATAEDTPISFPATDLLANDTPGPPNEAGQTLTVVSVSNGPGGGVTLNAGTIRFTPSLNYKSPPTASFTYKVRDNGTTNGAPAPMEWTTKVNVTVSAVNDTPLANDGTASVNEDAVTPVAIELGALVSDVETSDANLSYAIVAGPTNGTLGGAGASRTYSPNANANGSDSFTYRVSDRGDPDNCGAPSSSCDGPETSLIKTVSITIAEVNDAPTAITDARATAEDTALSFPASELVGNDSKGPANEGGQTLSVTAVGGAVNGTVVLAGGTVTFTPSPDFNDIAVFSYTVTDNGTSNGVADPQSDSAQVNVSVSAVNDPPTPAADTKTATEDAAVSFAAADLLVNDAAGPPNEAGQSLTVTAVGSAVDGSVSLVDGTITFTPNPGFAGAASFRYTIRDNGTTSGAADPQEATGTVTVNVSGAQDAPVAHDDAQTTPEDTTLS
ncbi:MAG: Ig-like domain-containing protein, partial [Actinomycetota bacterium]|nr:Ig-like domain-containing protein [Actinomycetota bacterium]